MSQPLRLSDSQMDAVMRAAQPLAPNVRVAFLEALAQVLAAQPVIGDGSVGRAIAATQRLPLQGAPQPPAKRCCTRLIRVRELHGPRRSQARAQHSRSIMASLT